MYHSMTSVVEYQFWVNVNMEGSFENVWNGGMQRRQKWLNLDFILSQNCLDFSENDFHLKILDFEKKSCRYIFLITSIFEPIYFCKKTVLFLSPPHSSISKFFKTSWSFLCKNILILYTQNWYFTTEVMQYLNLS